MFWSYYANDPKCSKVSSHVYMPARYVSSFSVLQSFSQNLANLSSFCIFTNLKAGSLVSAITESHVEKLLLPTTRVILLTFCFCLSGFAIAFAVAGNYSFETSTIRNDLLFASLWFHFNPFLLANCL